MRLRRAIPAGIIDAGLASIATFVLSLYAITKWQSADPALLGSYFLHMTAVVMASTVPIQFLFVPAEKVTLELPQPARAALYGRFIRLGAPVAVAAASLVSLAAFVGVSERLTLADQVPFWTTAAVAAAFLPLQTHARRVLHLCGRSWAAASISLVQVSAAGSALIVMMASSVDARWIPIGALALANIASTVTGSLVLRRVAAGLDPATAAAATDLRQSIGFRTLAPSGRWLVTVGVMSTGNNFLVESAVTLIVGLPALALAGSAKTVAQPILVLANGLRSVLGPHSMQAARDRDRKAARRVAKTFGFLTAAAVLGYSAIAGFDWIGNPLARLVDRAYTVPFLVILTIAANGLNGAAFSGRLELIGAAREARLLAAEVKANIAQLAVAVIAAFAAGSSTEAGAFARPVAFAALGLTRIFGYERALDAHYLDPAEQSDGAATIPTPSALPPE